MRTAFFLRNVPVLAVLSDELLERLAKEVRAVRIPAGHWIMREGDRAESMFIVSGGRIEVVHEGPPEILLRVLRRGDVLGELALLRDGARAASARAQRDTELLELGRSEFEHLIEHAPEFALGLTRAMGPDRREPQPGGARHSTPDDCGCRTGSGFAGGRAGRDVRRRP